MIHVPFEGTLCWCAGPDGELYLCWPGQVGIGQPTTNVLVHCGDGSMRWLLMYPVDGQQVRFFAVRLSCCHFKHHLLNSSINK